MNSKLNVSPRLYAYLVSWHETSTTKQREAGSVVNLPFQDFFDLFTARQLKTLEEAIAANRIRYLMDVKNPYALVLSWKSYAAKSLNVMDKTTATICSRMKSRQINLPQKGDTLREDHKEAIAKKLTGVAKTEEHRANMSLAQKGSKKAGWTEERKAERRKLIADKKAAADVVRKSAEDAAWAQLEAMKSGGEQAGS
ncbi:hypothetical protein GS397_06990 [Sphingobium yanoikuyae]|uniref:Uncharacterized protein n=1 Tax=Sphingobium yanoikuyae TaxID=13690 RepID=A0A6P1GE92_SPHYA|nr:hypothetical protein [Sphingobium yanoikuyae]QHD66815.1 hypothetical protein GS397_06990 [Sphingobium yanoikuyae]